MLGIFIVCDADEVVYGMQGRYYCIVVTFGVLNRKIVLRYRFIDQCHRSHVYDIDPSGRKIVLRYHFIDQCHWSHVHDIDPSGLLPISMSFLAIQVSAEE